MAERRSLFVEIVIGVFVAVVAGLIIWKITSVPASPPNVFTGPGTAQQRTKTPPMATENQSEQQRLESSPPATSAGTGQMPTPQLSTRKPEARTPPGTGPPKTSTPVKATEPPESSPPATSAGAGQTPTPQPNAQKHEAQMPALGPAPPVEFTAKGQMGSRIDLSFMPRGCRLQHKDFVCTVTITNNGEKTLEFSFVRGQCSLVDDFGNQYNLERISIGRKDQENLQPQVPINIVAVARDVDDRATRMTLLLGFVANWPESYTAAVRNIPIEKP